MKYEGQGWLQAKVPLISMYPVWMFRFLTKFPIARISREAAASTRPELHVCVTLLPSTPQKLQTSLLMNGVVGALWHPSRPQLIPTAALSATLSAQPLIILQQIPQTEQYQQDGTKDQTITICGLY